MPTRADGRLPDALRPVTVTRGFIGSAAGSCLYEAGRTRVICTVTVDNGVPPWMAGRGEGWLTAEYAMLPASTGRRKNRDGRGSGGVDGRSTEIQRLIGRALRQAVDLRALGERTLHIDCDVIEADGGTRCAAITGAGIALADAARGLGGVPFIRTPIAAVSVGIVAGHLLLDLDYREDAGADADFNVVMTGAGAYVEVQASAEKQPVTPQRLTDALDLSGRGIARLLDIQRLALALPPGGVLRP